MIQIKQLIGYALVAVMIGGISGPAFAEDDNFAARGLGAASCSQFIKDSLNSKDANFAYFSWVQGFLSGMNLATSDSEGKPLYVNLGAIPVAEQQLFIRQYCTKNPDEYLLGAALELYQSLPLIASDRR